MKKIGKQATGLLLALTLLLALLTGCGGGGGGKTPDFIYVPTYQKLDVEMENIGVSAFGDTALYFVGQVTDGSYTYTDPDSGESWESVTYRNKIYRTDIATGESTELTAFQPLEPADPANGSAEISAMVVDGEGNLWILENTYDYSAEKDGGAGSSVSQLVQLGQDGSAMQTIDLNAVCKPTELTMFSYLARCGEDICVADNSGTVSVISRTGELQYQVTLENPDQFNGLTAYSDGTAVVMQWTDSGRTATPLDSAAKKLGTATTMPAGAYQLFASNGTYLYCYNNGQSLYGCTKGGSEGQELFNWISSDIDMDTVMNLRMLSDDQVVCLLQEWADDEGNVISLVTMDKTPYAQATDRKTITLACMYLDYEIKNMVLEFNRTNKEYRIEVADYSQYNTDTDYNAGQTKLSAELISGNVPDILVASGLPVNQYGSKGLLEDLWPHIEQDMGRDALMSHVLDAMAQDGKLYQITPSFNISTVLTRADRLNGKDSWTVDEMMAIYKTMPEGSSILSQYDTRDSMLTNCVMMSMDKYVNWSTGECSFSDPSFVKLLEFAKSFPAEFDWDNVDWSTMEDDMTRLMSGKQLAATQYIGSFDDLMRPATQLEGKYAFVGYPTEDGTRGAFSIGSALAMSAKSEYKDVVWDFISQFLSEEYGEKQYGFSINQAAFEKQAEKAMTQQYEMPDGTIVEENVSDAVPVPMYSYSNNGSAEQNVYALAQEDYDKLMDLIGDIDSIYNYEEQIQSIINEEAQKFFNGQTEAQAAADLIQSRVKLYVNEQK